jgi:hypothetical protein
LRSESLSAQTVESGTNDVPKFSIGNCTVIVSGSGSVPSWTRQRHDSDGVHETTKCDSDTFPAHTVLLRIARRFLSAVAVSGDHRLRRCGIRSTQHGLAMSKDRATGQLIGSQWVTRGARAVPPFKPELVPAAYQTLRRLHPEWGVTALQWRS